ncbi:endo-1,4-beta-xylanase [Bradyrhizobium sp. BRP22]|uniref:endo-1,4-beta-xylanase n=1 Tax=Bradyrhizobium sp. BRP22 TaxID=2793821 RepID=UPI001CD7D993|nr:endo-1,4-beta-xylanase [Bradyrhizobium sp. BRP22]MCA1454135.1 endo-1,4-beta-xylanase [Bradyrhizobium sp. BRP22]
MRLLALLVLGLTLQAQILSSANAQASPDRIRATDDPRVDVSPWGIASGAEWLFDFPKFNPLLRTAGVQWLRAFYEWQAIQPAPGQFSWAETDRLVANAQANGLHLTHVFAYLASWASADGGTRKFPIKDMQFWRDYVSAVVTRYHKDVKYWEVWNEFNGSFAENGNAALYAELVKEASVAAKKIDPTAQIGMSVANFDVTFLDAAIKAGAAGYFDYICVHPYEKLGAIANNGEVDFLAMVPTLRHMLAANNLRNDMPLWITEIGARAPTKPQRRADMRQAVTLAKAYLLSLASGFQRVFWFEARGPTYGDQTDHGIIRADFTLRPSYHALKTITSLLGPKPARIGWLKLGSGGYGFMFSGRDQAVLAAWAPAATSVKFDAAVQVVGLSGNTTLLPAGQAMTLTDVPQFVLNVPNALVQNAAANQDRLSLWGDNYAVADQVTARLQSTNVENGLRQINPDTTIPIEIGNASWRRTNFAKPGSEGHYVYFAVTPQFVPFGTRELEITAVVKRTEPAREAGMSLDYESKSGYVNAGFLTVTQSDEWQELRWKIADVNFVGQWGWHFRLNAIASPNEFLVKEVRVKKNASR